MTRASRLAGKQASRIVAVAAIVLALAAPANAQTEVPPAPSWLEQAGATLTLRTGLWSSTRELDREGPFGAAMLWGKISKPISRQVSVFAEGWTSLRGPFDDGEARGELREAFATFVSGPIEVRVGRQIIAWGRADGINPTDNLTAQDLTLLAPDDSDRRIGAGAVRATYAISDVSITAIWLPEFRAHRVPLPAFVGDVATTGSEWRPEQFALRVEQVGRKVDWSASWFRGKDLAPDLAGQPGEQANGITGEQVNGITGEQVNGITGEQANGLTGEQAPLLLMHHDVNVIGADATGNVGRWGLRAEAAYVSTEDRDGVDPFVKNPFVFIVAGADRMFREHLNLNVQYLHRFVTHFRAIDAADASPINMIAMRQAALSGQARRFQHGASARVSYKWFHDTLEAEVAAAGYARPRGGMVRPKITYALSDRMKLLVGGEFYGGESLSTFGILRDNAGGFAEVRWSF